jgi:hypothetical protein
MTKTVYVLNLTSHDDDLYTAVFSTHEKARAAVVNYYREHWSDVADEDEDEKMPTNDADIIEAYFEIASYADGNDHYTIKAFQIDAQIDEGEFVEGGRSSGHTWGQPTKKLAHV